jgi:hypothetical protein
VANINPTPNSPANNKKPSALIDSAVKPATPDLILISEENSREELIINLLFEDIGSIEVLTIARSEIINGRNISYGLIPRLTDLARRHSPDNIFRISGSLAEFFNNFAIKLRLHIPENGTGPEKLYIGEGGSFNCLNFPVLDAITDEVVGCFNTLGEAQAFIEDLDLRRDIVYIDPQSGNLVVDVINLKNDNQVEIELLLQGTLENDTIY